MLDQNNFDQITHTAITVGSSNTAVLATADAQRRYVSLINDSDEAIYVNLGGTAVVNTGIRLNANGGSVIFEQGNVYTGKINAICASGSKTLLLTYTNTVTS